MEGLIVRDMSLEDLAEVHAIERACHSAPWTVKSFHYELGNEHAVLKVAHLFDRMAGYICIRTILDVTHLLNVAILPEYRRRGIGSILLRNAMDALKHPEMNPVLTLEVRESNIEALKLYEKFGFAIKGKRDSYYKKPDEDALIMELRLL